VRNFRALAPLVFRNRWTLTDAGVLDRTHLRFFVRASAVALRLPLLLAQRPQETTERLAHGILVY
jgi:hypothetical protein